jgi:hypothetical protein
MVEPVIIENRPFWPRVMVAFWVFEAIMGLVFAVMGAGWLGGAENGAAILFIAMGLVLALTGAAMSNVTWQIANLEGPAIELTEAGFRDFRLSKIQIAWNDLQWKLVFNGWSWSLQFDLGGPGRQLYRVSWGYRLLARFNRMFSYPEFTVLTLGTGRTAQQLAEAIGQFKPARA